MESKKAFWFGLAISSLISILLILPIPPKVFEDMTAPFTFIWLIFWIQAWLWLINGKERDKHRSDVNKASVGLGVVALIMFWTSLVNF
jgi:hypothetical protein